MVRTALALPAPGVIAAGEKEQVKVLGRLAQVSVTGLLKAPDLTCAETVIVPDFPAGMLMDSGEAPKDKVGGGPVVVTVDSHDAVKGMAPAM
jgi:hypothetical protein